MSLRVLAAVLCVLFLMAYAWTPGWRKLRPGWLFSTSGAVMMMALLENPDMPRSIGIPGLNLWNLLMINNVTAWLSRRELEGYEWDLPHQVKTRGLLFCGVMLVAFIRVFISDNPLAPLHGFNAFAAYFINCFKWLLPALILFDGIRSESQSRSVLLLVLSTYLLIALLTLKTMGLGGIGSGDKLSVDAARKLQRDVGYHRNDVSMMLAGGTWAIWSCAGLFRAWWQRFGVIGIGIITLLGQAMTGGRTGYYTFVVIGCILTVIKWRKLLIIGPIGLFILVTMVPAARERAMQGFASKEGGIVSERNTDEMTSGRVLVWPLTIEGIEEKPLFGWGRTGFQLSGIADQALIELREEWPHPHNAYLEYLLDNGLIGFFLTIPIYLTMCFMAYKLFSMKDSLPAAVGGAAFALFLALLFGGMGAQTLYTRESVVMMWAISGLLVRTWVETDKLVHGDVTEYFSIELEDEEYGQLKDVRDGTHSSCRPCLKTSE